MQPLLSALLVSFYLASASIAVHGKTRAPDDSYSLFEKPGKMVKLRAGNALSLYCSGSGFPTIVLEAGFRGGSYAAWCRLQPLLAKKFRTCSYDRAGYGFSELGQDLPRDLEHSVFDLHEMLHAAGEKAPYILAGHSNGGLIVGAFADRYPKEVAGLVFLDAAISLKKYPSLRGHLDKYLEGDLEHIRRCKQLAEQHDLANLTGVGSACINAESFDGLPAAMAQAETANETKPSYWAAILSESESNYSGQISAQAEALLPHHWATVPIRVITAAIPDLDDEQASNAFGIPEGDKASLDRARANRHGWESRQAEVCQFSIDCKALRIPTSLHLVQNADPETVVHAVEEVAAAQQRNAAAAAR
jgi:pimeloyl-ACP methyl ester carboxylesterase